MTHPSPAQEPRATSADEAGRSCPYCRFALKQGASVVECGSCRALHHAECWTDNSGCAIMGCAGAAGAAPTVAAPVAPPPPPPVQQQAAPYPPPLPGPDRGRSSTALIVAVLALALAVAGGATALVVSSGSSANPGSTPATVTQVVAQTSQQPTTEAVPATGTTTEETGTTIDESESNGALPDEDDAQMASGIQSVLLAHHEAIVRHDFRAAWVLTSQRYRAKKLREPGGYGAWESAQASLSRYLVPSDLQVSVTTTDSRSGVATIRVTGMGWSAPRSSCSSWEGTTWAKYENDHWRYEPGYSISDQRRAQWQPRRDELLGWGC